MSFEETLLKSTQEIDSQEVVDTKESQKKEGTSVEDKINADVFLRARRNVNLASLIEKEDVSLEEENKLRRVLESRSWHKIMKNLEKGDLVVTALTPSDKFLSIKNLNDNVFGPQVTDSIIAKRRQVANEIFEIEITKMSVEHGVRIDNFDDLNLEQNYKYGVYKIPGEMASKIDRDKFLNTISEHVNQRMIDEIESQIEIALVKAKSEGDDVKIGKINDFKDKFISGEFRLGMGVGAVEEEDIKTKTLAMAKSMQGSKLSGIKKEGLLEAEDNIEAVPKKVVELREVIIDNGNFFVDDKGREFEVFLKNSDGTKSLNRDLLRDVRKDLIKASDPEQSQKLDQIKQYLDLINSIDFIKPFTNEEVDSFEEKNKQISQIESGEIKKIKDLVRKNEKNENFIANEIFESEAIKIDNCTYLNLDVLDIGVDQLLNYEKLLIDVAGGSKSFEEISIEADDLITKRLQDIRNKAHEIIKDYKDGELLTEDGLSRGFLGGDELIFAIDNSKTNKEELEEIIFKLKKETNTRVARTVIAKSERDSVSDDEDIRIKEHLAALERSEKGINEVKSIEKLIQDSKQEVFSLIKSQEYTGGEEDSIESILNSYGLNTLVAVEGEGKQVKFITQKNKKVYSPDQIVDLVEEFKLAARLAYSK